MSPSSRFGQALYLILGATLLFAVPVLDVARKNLRFLDWNDFWTTLSIVAGIPALVVAVVVLLFPKRIFIAAGLIAVHWLLTNFFSISAAYDSLDIAHPDGAGLLTILGLVPVIFIVLGLLPARLISATIGTVGCALFGLSAIQLTLAMGNDDLAGAGIDPISRLDGAPLPEPGAAPERLPDIIYIVPDRYANARVLADAFGHDNTGFLDALRQHGFAVAEAARANYLKTRYSLASSMNMQYIEPLLDELEGRTLRGQPLYTPIKRNLVVDRLRKLGYRYVHVGSWWDPTSKNGQADLSVDFGLPYFGGEFGHAVSSRLLPVRLLLDRIQGLNGCTAFKRQLSYLETAGGDAHPTFVFAHILAPHDPILTDEEGDCIPPVTYPGRASDVSWENFRSAYSGYVTYLNRRFLEIFDRQRSANPNPVIFVLQADEGPYPRAYREDGIPRVRGELWENATDSELAMKFGILNALYLGEPGEMAGLPDVPERLSPVNNWRIIFGRIEGAEFPLLPDRHFIFPSDAEPYRSIEVTERLSAIP